MGSLNSLTYPEVTRGSSSPLSQCQYRLSRECGHLGLPSSNEVKYLISDQTGGRGGLLEHTI